MLATPLPAQASPLAQDVQVDGWRLGQGLQSGMYIFDAVALLGVPLPAALHNGVDLRRAGTRPLQLTSLRDALDHLGRQRHGGEGTEECGQDSEAGPGATLPCGGLPKRPSQLVGVSWCLLEMCTVSPKAALCLMLGSGKG